MSQSTLRWTTPGLVMMLPVATLALVLMTRGTLGIQADPLKTIAAFFAIILALVVAVKHPAAFAVPVLFVPRLMKVGALKEFGPAGNYTALQLACMLFGAGLVLRWLLVKQRRHMDEYIFDRSRELEELESNRSVSGPLLAFLIFAAVVAFSYLYTVAPQYGAQKLIAFSTLGCAMPLLPFVLFLSDSDFLDFTLGTALFGLLVAATSLSFSATGAMGPQDNPAHIGKGQVMGLAILLLVYMPIQNRWLKAFVLFACIPALAVGLVSAEARGPLFSLALVLILSFFVESFRSPVITRKQTAFVGAALVGAVMLLSTFWFYGAEASKFQYKATEIVSLLENSSEAKGTAVERLVFYRAAVELWTERPLLGWGIGGWSMAYWHMEAREYPHNIFLETLVEQGLFGFAALTLFLYSTFRHWRACQAQIGSRLPCLLPGFVYLISIAMSSGDLDDDRFIWFWCGLMLAGCTLAARTHGGDACTADQYSAQSFEMPAVAMVSLATDDKFENSHASDSGTRPPEACDGGRQISGVSTMFEPS